MRVERECADAWRDGVSAETPAPHFRRSDAVVVVADIVVVAVAVTLSLKRRRFALTEPRRRSKLCFDV